MPSHFRFAVSFLLTLATCLLPAGAKAAEADPWSALTTLEGAWVGQLEYLDYQSGKRQVIPLELVREATPDDAFLVTRSRFTDPGFFVHTLTVNTIDPESGQLQEVFFEDRKIERFEFEIESFEVRSSKTGRSTAWTLVYGADGTDDQRPARLRYTMRLEGESLSLVKEVRFLDAESDFIFRNEVKVERQKNEERAAKGER